MNKKFAIRIGNQTSFSAASPLAPFEYAVANNFRAFEWFPDKKASGQGWEITDLDRKTRAAIRKTAASHDLALAVHGPWQATPRDPGGLAILAEHVEFAREIGATLLNIHCDAEPDPAAFAKALEPLIAQTRAAGLKLAIENTVSTPPEELNALFQGLGQLGAENIEHVGVCFDIGHANLCSVTRNDYIAYLDRLAPAVPIIHVHGHENYGDRDSHLPLFTGPAAENDAGISALVYRLVNRGFQGSLILEQWPEPPELLTRARDRLLALVAAQLGPAAPIAPAKVAAASVGKVKKKLVAAAPFAEALAAMDRQARSWREKLLGVAELLENSPDAESEAQLVYLAIYLRFLNTGEIVCREDGRHFRPSHHARASQAIQERLLAGSGASRFLVRKILPWLPSYEDDFLRREPLTRIRDIAHRNDIPRELKQEIKHRLQNKLHRCAGPEDLQTSADILGRITAPGAGYAPDFVEQFRVFHAELQDFFNAPALEARLEAIGATAQDKKLPLAIARFLAAKRAKPTTINQLLHLLEQGVRLRAALVVAAYGPGTMALSNYRMAEIQLEDYGFAVLSELVGKLETKAGDFPWSAAFDTLGLTVAHLRLSEIEPAECRAIEAALAAWGKDFRPEERESLLLVKAMLARAMRLAEDYSAMILALFAQKAEELGGLLAIPAHAVRVYSEGDIRGSIIFQFAKLTSLLLDKVRKLAKLSPWDIIVHGTAAGRLLRLARLSRFAPDSASAHILLLAEASGDEEIPAGVTAIILVRSIPHLSHLAIRARQEGVVLVALTDRRELTELTAMQDEVIRLAASGEEVVVSLGGGERPPASVSRPVAVAAVSLAEKTMVLPLPRATLANSGGKGFGAGQLAELAATVGFRVPRGLVIPFGVLATALGQPAALHRQYVALQKRLPKRSGKDLEHNLAELRAIIDLLAVDPAIIMSIIEYFGAKTPLMVRSSANCEDLEAMSGAGLYDSVANVRGPAIAEAIRQVWGSLWTRRAVLSRQRAGISHGAAQMAILVQELLVPDYSFVLHTVNPMNNNPAEIYLELAVGLGEILASAGQPGVPLRMICRKDTGAARLLAFADFSRAARPGAHGGVEYETVDYSRDRLTCDREFRGALAKKLAELGGRVEKTLGRPQDIEGVVVGQEIYLVQSRPQMLKLN